MQKKVIGCNNFVMWYLFKKDRYTFRIMGNNDADRVRSEDEQSSVPSFLPHVSTLYTRKSAKLIRSAEKGTSLIIIAIAVLIVISLIDTFEVENASELLPRDLILDVLVSFFSVVVLGLTGIMFLSLLRSRRTLEKWADMFEQNAMRTSLSIALSGTSKEEIVRALPEVVEELGKPLEAYISKGPFTEFFDVIIKGQNRFDILIDSQRIISSKDQLNLKQLLSEYGAIAARIIDKDIDENDVALFSDNLRRYKLKSENDIGLAILVCSKISSKAETYVRNSRDLLERKIVMVEISNNEELHSSNLQNSHLR
jgi:hypothetical protein